MRDISPRLSRGVLWTMRGNGTPLRRLALMGVVLGLVASPVLAAAPDSIDIIASGDLSVTLTDPEGKGEIGIAVRNSDTQDATLTVSYEVPGKTESEISALLAISPSQITVPAGTTTAHTISFERKGKSGTLTGFLAVTGNGATDAAPLTVSTGLEPTTERPSQIVILAFIVGLSLAVFRALTVPGILRRFRYHLGELGWSFEDSWATNLTAIGAILGTVATAGFLPDEPMLLSKEAYAGLNLFFGSVVVLAPFVFVATATLTKTKEGQRRDGYVFWFVVSAGLTLSAVIGELMTLALLLTDGFLRGTSALLINLVAVVVAIGGFFVLIHAWRTIPWTIHEFAPEAGAPPPAAPSPARISLL